MNIYYKFFIVFLSFSVLPYLVPFHGHTLCFKNFSCETAALAAIFPATLSLLLGFYYVKSVVRTSRFFHLVRSFYWITVVLYLVIILPPYLQMTVYPVSSLVVEVVNKLHVYVSCNESFLTCLLPK
jgi:hypothetical protein